MHVVSRFFFFVLGSPSPTSTYLCYEVGYAPLLVSDLTLMVTGWIGWYGQAS